MKRGNQIFLKPSNLTAQKQPTGWEVSVLTKKRERENRPRPKWKKNRKHDDSLTVSIPAHVCAELHITVKATRADLITSAIYLAESVL